MKKVGIIKISSIVLFLISLLCTIDLGMNYLYNLNPALHDGSYVNKSTLQNLFQIFGDQGWTIDKFYQAFEISVWITFILAALTVILQFIKSKDHKILVDKLCAL